jgi:hypothetical protein
LKVQYKCTILGGLLGYVLFSLFTLLPREILFYLLEGVAVGFLIITYMYIAFSSIWPYALDNKNNSEFQEIYRDHRRRFAYFLWGFFQIPVILFAIMIGLAGANGYKFLTALAISFVVYVFFKWIFWGDKTLSTT